MRRDLKTLESDTQRLSGKLAGMLAAMREKPNLDLYTGSVDDAEKRLKTASGTSIDIKIRRFKVGGERGIAALLVYIDGLVDPNQVNEDVLGPLLYCQPELVIGKGTEAHEAVISSVIRAADMSLETHWSKMLPKLSGGNTLLLLDGDPHGIIVNTTKFPQRQVDSPETEQTVRGSREGFTDVLLTNLSLIRRRLQTPKLRMHSMQIGRLSKTGVTVLCVQGVTNPLLVRTIVSRLRSFNRDTLESEQQLVGLLSDRPMSLFPQARLTERVDEAVRSLGAGKVAVVIDGTTSVITLPATFLDFYQTSQDYASSFWEASLVRVIRTIAWLLNLYLPSLYVALTSVNPNLLPAKLTFTLSGAHETVPFPPVIEVFLMFVIIEILREAAIRLPKPMSQTLGTVGAIVLGTAMAKADLISNVMVIIVTISALANFTTPVVEMTTPWRILLWVMVAAAYMFGLFGIVLVSVYLAWSLASTNSLGTPYLSPLAPLRVTGLRDSLVRFPLSILSLKRPASTAPIRVKAGTRVSLNRAPVRLKAYQSFFRRDEP